ncbi:hypothetical protein HN011_003499 [Eciton burchellii]|nr:hypothetical protein HN011_003499 [Eciton burchellii]
MDVRSGLRSLTLILQFSVNLAHPTPASPSYFTGALVSRTIAITDERISRIAAMLRHPASQCLTITVGDLRYDLCHGLMRKKLRPRVKSFRARKRGEQRFHPPLSLQNAAPCRGETRS